MFCPQLKLPLVSWPEAHAFTTYPHLHVHHIWNVLMRPLSQFLRFHGYWQCAQHLSTFAFLKGLWVATSFLNDSLRPVSVIMASSWYISLQFLFWRSNDTGSYMNPSEPWNVMVACDPFLGNKAGSIFSTLDSTELQQR